MVTVRQTLTVRGSAVALDACRQGAAAYAELAGWDRHAQLDRKSVSLTTTPAGELALAQTDLAGRVQLAPKDWNHVVHAFLFEVLVPLCDATGLEVEIHLSPPELPIDRLLPARVALALQALARVCGFGDVDASVAIGRLARAAHEHAPTLDAEPVRDFLVEEGWETWDATQAASAYANAWCFLGLSALERQAIARGEAVA